MVSEGNRAILDALLDQLIPANPAKGIPAAGDFGSGRFILEQAVKDEELDAALAVLLKRAGELASAGINPSVARQLEAELPEEFSKLLVLTYMAYYSRPEIRALFGVGEHPVHPKGYDVNRETPELMDTLTAPVRARGKVYRDA